MSTVVNGYRLPEGKSGNAVRWIVDRLLERPRVGSTKLLREACAASNLSPVRASWLVQRNSDKSPVGKLWDRMQFKGCVKLFLLPGAEVLGGTFVPFDVLDRVEGQHRADSLGFTEGDLLLWKPPRLPHEVVTFMTPVHKRGAKILRTTGEIRIVGFSSLRGLR